MNFYNSMIRMNESIDVFNKNLKLFSKVSVMKEVFPRGLISKLAFVLLSPDFYSAHDDKYLYLLQVYR